MSQSGSSSNYKLSQRRPREEEGWLYYAYSVKLIELLFGESVEFLLGKRAEEQVCLERASLSALVDETSDLGGAVFTLASRYTHWGVDAVDVLSLRRKIHAVPLGFWVALGVVEIHYVRREGEWVRVGKLGTGARLFIV